MNLDNPLMFVSLILGTTAVATLPFVLIERTRRLAEPVLFATISVFIIWALTVVWILALTSKGS